jgi:hypothetical protein
MHLLVFHACITCLCSLTLHMYSLRSDLHKRDERIHTHGVRGGNVWIVPPSCDAFQRRTCPGYHVCTVRHWWLYCGKVSGWAALATMCVPYGAENCNPKGEWRTCSVHNVCTVRRWELQSERWVKDLLCAQCVYRTALRTAIRKVSETCMAKRDLTYSQRIH